MYSNISIVSAIRSFIYVRILATFLLSLNISGTILNFYSMKQERTAIIELFRNGKNPGEILKLLNFPKMPGKFIYRTIKRYTDTGRVSDKSRSGRPVYYYDKDEESSAESYMAKSPSVCKKNGCRTEGISIFPRTSLLESRNRFL